MEMYTLGVRTTGAGNASPAWEIRSGSSRLYVRELGVFMAAATASTFGIGRPAAIGVTPTSPVTLVAEDTAAPAGSGQSALAWGTAPTAPTAFIRRFTLPATVGAGVIYSWWNGPGLIIPTSSSLVLWNLAVNGVVDAYVIVGD